ncbi:MAG: hypothetical protein ACK4MG_03030 [Aquabacterium sp.]
MVDRAIDHPLTPRRRWFLKTALAIGAVGATLGGVVYWHRGMRDGQLTPHGRSVFRALALGFVGPMLPADPTEREAALQRHVDSIAPFLENLPQVLQVQVNSIVGLLANGLTRRMLTGLDTDWDSATPEQLAAAFDNMRLHPLPSNRLTYQVVRSVTCMTFFANREHWTLTGYPGPSEI